MLDRKYILENLEAVKENCRNRNMQVDVDRFAQLEALRREKQRLSEDLNREANAISKSIGQAKTPEEREERKEQGRAVREQVAALKAELDRIEAELDTVWRAIPNMAHPDAPIGDDDTCNTTRDYGKTPVPAYDFTPLDHVELAEKLDLIDFEGGARVAGSGFYFLKNEAVLRHGEERHPSGDGLHPPRERDSDLLDRKHPAEHDRDGRNHDRRADGRPCD